MCRNRIARVVQFASDRSGEWADDGVDVEVWRAQESLLTRRRPVEMRVDATECIWIQRARRFGAMEWARRIATTPVCNAIRALRWLLHLPDENVGEECMQKSWWDIEYIASDNGDACQQLLNTTTRRYGCGNI